MNPDTAFETPKKRSLKKIIFLVLLLIIYSAIVLGAGIILGTDTKRSASSKINQLAKLSNPEDPMYANLQGSLTGKIVKIEGNKAYVESQKGGKGVFNINNPVLVSEVFGGKIVNVSNTPDEVILNEIATIKIAGFGNGYSITSVTYFKDNPPVLNAPLNPNESMQPGTSSAKPKK